MALAKKKKTTISNIPRKPTEQECITKLIIILEELGFSNFSEKFKGAVVVSNKAEKIFPCRLENCKIDLRLIVNFTYNPLFNVPVASFYLEHHIGDRMYKGIIFHSKKIHTYRQERKVFEIYEEATKYIIENTYKYANFIDSSPGIERSKLVSNWNDHEFNNSHFLATPRFNKEEICFKSCEIDLMEEHTRYFFRVSKERGYRGVVLQRW